MKIPAIGLRLEVPLSSADTGGALVIIETTSAPGSGPPRHRHHETEIFRVVEGSYLFELDGHHVTATAGDVVTVLGGVEHGYVNIGDAPGRQYVIMTPGMDAIQFYSELGEVMANGVPDSSTLIAFGTRWGMEFLGPPLRPQDALA